MKLKFEVRAERNSEPLAAFQYKKWAEEWKARYCATGIIVELGQHVLLGGDRTDTMIPIQEDGGGTRLIAPDEHPGFPRDGGKL